MQNQSNRKITLNTQLKTAALNKRLELLRPIKLQHNCNTNPTCGEKRCPDARGQANR